jgi:hypothetical protein
MILHLGHDLPVKEARELDCESPAFTSEEMRIVKNQIRRNMVVIDEHICRIDLFVNHERHASRAGLIEHLRERLGVLMEENDTFREVLWKQYQNLGANLT